jgi:hypothetical protein
MVTAAVRLSDIDKLVLGGWVTVVLASVRPSPPGTQGRKANAWLINHVP